MYHAVMEEVVRFLERCHQSLAANQAANGAPIARSKSVNHVFLPNHMGKQSHHPLIDLDAEPPVNGRQRTSTRIVNEKPVMGSMQQHQRLMGSLDENLDLGSRTGGDPFGNFTW